VGLESRSARCTTEESAGSLGGSEGYAAPQTKSGRCSSSVRRHQHVTGLTDALMDSIPLVCITGQVPTHSSLDAFLENTGRIPSHSTSNNLFVQKHHDLCACCTRHFRRLERGPARGVDIPKDVSSRAASIRPA